MEKRLTGSMHKRRSAAEDSPFRGRGLLPALNILYG